MQKISLIIASMVIAFASAFAADTNTPTSGTPDSGFWYSVELGGGSSLNPHLAGNAAPIELDFTAGYRLNQYFRIGLGIGARYYLRNDHLRLNSDPWAYPIYLNLRGNIIPTRNRLVTPFYSLNVGGTIRDGIMWSPTLGIRIGHNRNAALIGISYLGQKLDRISYFGAPDGIKGEYDSFLMLRLGYEF